MFGTSRFFTNHASTQGSVLFTASGSTALWTVPPGVTSYCAVAIGGGATSNSNHGSGGGGLAYVNNVSCTPGDIIPVFAGGAGQKSYIAGTFGATGGIAGGSGGAGGAPFGHTGGASGGSGGAFLGGGGGCGGYSGAGGAGASGSFGAGAGGSASGGNNSTTGGGGVAPYGQGSSGVSAGAGGSGGTSAQVDGAGGQYGGGGSGAAGKIGSNGVVRIIWGEGRLFPSTNTGIVGAETTYSAPGTFANWNPSDKGTGITLSNSNLTAVNSSGTNQLVRSTIGKSSGKWYWEVKANIVREDIGVANLTESVNTFAGASTNSVGYNNSGIIFYNSAVLASVASYAANDIIGIALNMTAGTVAFYKNNVLQYTYSGLTGTQYAAGGGTSNANSSNTANFGATALKYSPPTGFNAGLY